MERVGRATRLRRGHGVPSIKGSELSTASLLSRQAFGDEGRSERVRAASEWSRGDASDPPTRTLRRGRHRWANREVAMVGGST